MTKTKSAADASAMACTLHRIDLIQPIGGIVPHRQSHRHNCAELLLLVRGGYRVEGLHEHALTLQPGQALLIPPGREHAFTYATTDGTTGIWCLGWEGPRQWPGPVVVDDVDAALQMYLRLVHRLHVIPQEAESIYCRQLLACIESEVLRLSAAPGPRHGLEALAAHLDTFFWQPLSVANLCRMFGLGRSTLFARFKQAYGTSPHRYVAHRRAEHARHLLLTTDLPFAEVARRVGLGGHGQLARLCQQLYGASLSALRRQRIRTIGPSG